MRTLSTDEARAVYDRIGARQDTQAFYEDVATGALIEHGDFAAAQSVLEFGCGTGRFAETLLRDHLGPAATYRALDLSPTMVGLAEGRLAPFGSRASVLLTDGGPPVSEPDDGFDRFVSNYVFDLLSADQIAAVIAEAHRILRPGGLLCVSSLSPGHDALSRGIIHVWSAVHRLSPRLVAGCRPIELPPFLADVGWTVREHVAVTPFGLPSEVVVAERLPLGAGA